VTEPREAHPPDARFSPAELEAFLASKILGVRSGTAHRYTGVWVVVVGARVFVRSWNDKPTGWYRAFLETPEGSVQLPDREVAVGTKRTRSPRLQEAVTAAYAEKYPTKASQKWIVGFAEPHRLRTTLELVPARAGGAPDEPKGDR
jgi:hypothetical protein